MSEIKMGNFNWFNDINDEKRGYRWGCLLFIGIALAILLLALI